MCITGTLSHSTLNKSFDWAGSDQLADFLALTEQVAFSKCIFQCLNVPAPIALSVVFNSPLYFSIFSRGLCMTGDVIYPLNAVVFDTGVFEVVSEMNSDVSVLSGSDMSL